MRTQQLNIRAMPRTGLCTAILLAHLSSFAQQHAAGSAPDGGEAVMELGPPVEQGTSSAPASPPVAEGPAKQAAIKAKKSKGVAQVRTEQAATPNIGARNAADGTADESIHRIAFRRAPVSVSLSTSHERLLTFPNPVAIHLSNADGLLQVQIIDRTAYVRALATFKALRIVAEDLVTGKMIPLDLTASSDAVGIAASEVEVFYATSSATGTSLRDGTEPADGEGDEGEDELDEVQLARFAAQSVYAPRRLVPATPGVRQVPVTQEPVSGLLRGARVAAVPLGQWRSGHLYVVAVRVTNLQGSPVDLDLRELRGNWRAAASQHKRLLAAGNEADTSTLYLVCDRPFEACR